MMASDSLGQDHVLGHDRHSFGVDTTQERIFKEEHQKRLGRLLQGHQGRRLEPQPATRAQMLRDIANEPTKRQLGNQEMGTFLELANLLQGLGSRSISAFGRLLDLLFLHSYGLWRDHDLGFDRIHGRGLNQARLSRIRFGRGRAVLTTRTGGGF